MGAAAFSILAITVSLSLARPTIGPIRIHHSSAAIIGALLTLLLGIVPLGLAVAALEMLLFPVITIISIMAVTLIAEQSGLFQIVANTMARTAKGGGHRLFASLFFAGTITGTVFTNDAAVLIFTPLVFNLIEDVRLASWRRENALPYYFAVLYIANVVGALVISNPINIVLSGMFRISFIEYAAWMVLPALASIVVSYIGLRYFFKHITPARYVVPPAAPPVRNRAFTIACAVVLCLTLVGFFTEGLTGMPTWLTALSGAVVLFVLHGVVRRSNNLQIVRGIGWDVIVFVIGIFIVALGLRNAGLTEAMSGWIVQMAGDGIHAQSFVTGVLAALSSSVMNNHPTADMMTWVIRDLSLPDLETKFLALSALIGGDLGPKMLPIGSLAALIWFRILRDKGVHVPYSLYIKVGVPVTLAALFVSLLVLNLELVAWRLWG